MGAKRWLFAFELVGSEMLTIVVSKLAIKIDAQTANRMRRKDSDSFRVRSSMVMALLSYLISFHVCRQ